jgi:hypothetical protein
MKNNKIGSQLKIGGLLILSLILIGGCVKEVPFCEKEVPLIEQKPIQVENIFEGMVNWDESNPNYYRKQAYCLIDNMVVWTDGCNCWGCKYGICFSTVVGCYVKGNYTWDGNLSGTHWLEIEEAKERGLI